MKTIFHAAAVLSGIAAFFCFYALAALAVACVRRPILGGVLFLILAAIWITI